MRWRQGLTLLLLAATPPGLGAQERVEDADLPPHVQEEVAAFFNRPSTIRFTGRSEIPAGGFIQSDVAVLRGPFTVAGEIDGDLMVVNGNLSIVGDGFVTGDVTVLGGRLIRGERSVGGQLTVYSEAVRYVRRGDRIVIDTEPRWQRSRRGPSSRISVRNEGSYNRVEGLPVMVGPVVRTGGTQFTRIDALAVWRTDWGLDTDQLGYFLRAEQHFGPEGRFTIGATAHSVIGPIERWGISDAETSLATFLFHEDYRDFYEREGYSAFLGFEDRQAGVSLRGEYRDEKHAFVPAGSPWTLKDNDGPWRPQPLVGRGDLRSVKVSLTVDGRNDRDDPSDGTYMNAYAVFGLEGDLEMPTRYAPLPAPAGPPTQGYAVNNEFRTGFLDLRHYARLGPSSDVRVRGVLAGSLDEEPLPPQYQHALGGAGSLPGYDLMSIDCGARDRRVSVFHDRGDGDARVAAFPAYGCDRIALFQAEYRGDFHVDIDLGDDDWGEDWDWYPAVDFSPSWSIFFNAGRGWSLSDPASPGYFGPDTQTFADVGAGFLFGDIGLYWAYPLHGDNRDVNFFLRIDHRF
jgi:hypothetical protein